MTSTDWQVYLFSNETKFHRVVWINNTTPELYVHNVDCDVAYRVRIAAYNRIGPGPLSDVMIIGNTGGEMF